MAFLLPFGYALALWWASTGAIIVLFRLPRRTYPLSFAGVTLVGLAALWGLVATRDDTSLTGAYLAFTCGTLLWGWQLTAFYMGYVTGPPYAPGSAPPGGLPRFVAAAQAGIYHELAAAAGAGLVLALAGSGANRLGAWTYLLLWLMHLAAKLNVFFGVRNFTAALLPEHLRHLGEFFRERPMNLFFPLSVTVAVAVAALILQRAFSPAATPFESAGAIFLGFMMLLGLLEIWLLMTPPAGTPWGEP